MNPTPKKHEIDMCTGPLVPKLLKFSGPLMLSGILQLSFSTVNMVIVGRYRGDSALAAIGATFNLTELLLFVFMGLAVGANVLVARYIGAKDGGGVEKTVHTAITASLVGGVIFGAAGLLLSKPLLRFTGTPGHIIEQSAVYMRVFFCGLPGVALYNFGSAILRAAGDTKTPLFFLGAGGVVNMALTLLFVLAFGAGIGGVAIAGVLSQGLAAVLVLRSLIRSKSAYAVHLKRLRIDWGKLAMIVKIGVPEGFQRTMYAIANVLIQSSINSFGTDIIAGNTAAITIEGFVYTALNALPQAAIAFTGQNMGAGNYKNITKIYVICSTTAIIASAAMCSVMVFERVPLVRIFSAAPAVVAAAGLRLFVVGIGYFLNMLINITAGVMRGMGASLLPAFVSFGGICLFRIIWLVTVFPSSRSYLSLLLTYPASWILTLFVDIACFIVVKRRILGRAPANVTGSGRGVPVSC